MTVEILRGDCRALLAGLADGGVNCVVTSPPYWGLRDYGADGQLGMEATPEAFVDALVGVFRQVRLPLADDGVCWLNLGDSYATKPGKGGNIPQTKWGKNTYPGHAAHRSRDCGLKPKDLVGIPWMVAFALRADGWYLRRDVIWSKPNAMPESVRDRPSSAHEYVFLLTKSERYFYDDEAVRSAARKIGSPGHLKSGVNSREHIRRTPNAGKGTDKQSGHGRRHDGFNERWDGMTNEEQQANGASLRSVWNIATRPFAEAHFATFPPKLAEICIKAGCPPGGTVLDPFGGAGTVGLVADGLARNAVLMELNPAYADMAEARIATARGPLLNAMDAAE